MNRKLRNTLYALAVGASLMAVLALLSPWPAPALAEDDGASVAPARQAIQHGIAMPFFSFRPRS